MDKKTKSIVFLVGIVVVAAIALKLIITYWWTFIVAALAFGIGYFIGKAGKSKKK